MPEYQEKAREQEPDDGPGERPEMPEGRQEPGQEGRDEPYVMRTVRTVNSESGDYGDESDMMLTELGGLGELVLTTTTPDAPPQQVGEQTTTDGGQALVNTESGSGSVSPGLIGTATFIDVPGDGGVGSALLNDLVVASASPPRAIFVRQLPRSSGRGQMDGRDYGLLANDATALRPVMLQASDAAVSKLSPDVIAAISPAQLKALESRPTTVENYSTTSDGVLTMGRFTSGFTLDVALFLDGDGLQKVRAQIYELQGYQSDHFIFGPDPLFVPFSGRATYAFGGGTPSTVGDGSSIGIGVTAGELLFDFGLGTGQINMAVTHGFENFAVLGGLELETDSRFFIDTNVLANTTDDAYQTSIDGFFSAPNERGGKSPAAAGLSYVIGTDVPIHGVAGFGLSGESAGNRATAGPVAAAPVLETTTTITKTTADGATITTARTTRTAAPNTFAPITRSTNTFAPASRFATVTTNTTTTTTTAATARTTRNVNAPVFTAQLAVDTPNEVDTNAAADFTYISFAHHYREIGGSELNTEAEDFLVSPMDTATIIGPIVTDFVSNTQDGLCAGSSCTFDNRQSLKVKARAIRNPSGPGGTSSHEALGVNWTRWNLGYDVSHNKKPVPTGPMHIISVDVPTPDANLPPVGGGVTGVYNLLVGGTRPTVIFEQEGDLIPLVNADLAQPVSNAQKGDTNFVVGKWASATLTALFNTGEVEAWFSGYFPDAPGSLGAFQLGGRGALSINERLHSLTLIGTVESPFVTGPNGFPHCSAGCTINGHTHFDFVGVTPTAVAGSIQATTTPTGDLEFPNPHFGMAGTYLLQGNLTKAQ